MVFKAGLGSPTACRQKYVADLFAGQDLAAVLPLGDVQYEEGTYSDYLASYDLSWGNYRSITRPAVGNHEYLTAGAKDYFTYFGAAAGDPSKGYYSYDLGSWHVVVLNSNCSEAGGCGKGSQQEQWLRADLARTPARRVRPRIGTTPGAAAVSTVTTAASGPSTRRSTTTRSRWRSSAMTTTTSGSRVNASAARHDQGRAPVRCRDGWQEPLWDRRNTREQ